MTLSPYHPAPPALTRREGPRATLGHVAKVIQYAGADLYPKQREAIFDPARIVCIEASTKAGKTVGCLAWLAELALLEGRPGRAYWWCAPVFGQADIAFRRMKAKLPRAYYKANQSKLTISLVNGATIWFKSAERSDDLFGEDVFAVVMDEASRMREASWLAIRSTLTHTEGPVRMIGNVKGRKNFFYTLCREAEKGAEGMAYHRITAWDAVAAGVLARAEIEAAYRDFERLGREGAFNQLYLAEPGEDGDNPFGLAAIEACVVERLSTEYAKAAGVDLAGRGAQNMNGVADDEAQDRDYTAVVLLDRDGYATHISRFRKGPADTTADLARIVKNTSALVDSTGAGDPIVEALQRRGNMRVEGYTFTERSRQDLLEGLGVKIGEEGVGFPDGWLRDELDAFEYRYTARGIKWCVPDGNHDDGAMAMALAVRKLPWKRRHNMVPVGVAKPGGSMWLGDGAPEGDPLLGSPQIADPAEETPIPVPVAVGGTGINRWAGAG